MEKAKFQPNSQVLLIEPSALGLEFILAGPQISQPFETIGSAAIVRVTGPLSYGNLLFDSYEGIKARVKAACDSDAKTVILKIASPGGDVSGAFDCARAVKAFAKQAGKRLIAYTDENACSAAYAIMCVADEICASVTGKVGHIGAIAQYAETTAADRAAGITYNTLVTGDLKAAGNPHVAMSDETRGALQAQLEEAGGIFYNLVAAHRPLSVAAIEALQAGTFLGESARAAKLIDKVYSWEELLSYVDGLATIPEKTASLEAKDSKDSLKMPDLPEDKKDSKAKAEEDKKEDKKEDMKSILSKAAAAGDAKAAKALKAYESDEDEKKAKAEDDEDKKDKAKSEAPKKDEEKAMSALAAELAISKAETAALKARLDAQDATAAAKARAEFFASIGASEALIKGFEGLPLDQCKAILSAAGPAFKSQASELVRQPTQGGTNVDGPSDNAALNAKMGLVKFEQAPSATFDGVIQSFGNYQEKK